MRKNLNFVLDTEFHSLNYCLNIVLKFFNLPFIIANNECHLQIASYAISTYMDIKCDTHGNTPLF